MNWVVRCTICGSSFVYESGQGLPDLCSVCSERKNKEVKEFLDKANKRKAIISVNTNELRERKIVKTLGIVSHEHIFGVGLIKDLDLQKFNGGVALSWEEKINNGRDLSIRYLEDEAIELGGNGVVGVDVGFRVLGIHNDMMMMLVSAQGTAVVLE
jgi:uncharacterized protein YbjQ (UPF0145 family)